MEPLVERAVHDTHSAAADLAVDAVVADSTHAARTLASRARARRVRSVVLVRPVGHLDGVPPSSWMTRSPSLPVALSIDARQRARPLAPGTSPTSSWMRAPARDPAPLFPCGVVRSAARQGCRHVALVRLSPISRWIESVHSSCTRASSSAIMTSPCPRPAHSAASCPRSNPCPDVESALVSPLRSGGCCSSCSSGLPYSRASEHPQADGVPANVGP
jgi:hypothetical protein